MAFPKPDSYKTHNGPYGSPSEWKRKVSRVRDKAVPSHDAKVVKALGILGIEDFNDVRSLKRAFRRAALRAHPDHGGTSEGFQEVQSAYELLMNRRG
jgi:hypothetical protein